ncbi:MAG TPA: hypothetical protein VLI41_02515 [Phenylobacterium sp.]|uniref:hypothetical protein n=1 Tax=Phenylobacterium sp. TaxID=1871053 RepID=UPI002BBA7D31|nr:hypothetical protein [Phenylobacterium sp.]HSV02054.1 hypothetical protein [Phenylobacterium sp.]
MRASSLIAWTALAALGLAGCNQGRGAGGVNGVCKPFTTANAQTTAPAAATSVPGAAPSANAPADPAAALDDCLHRWGYTLATSTDPANFVADATLAACGSQLAGWNQQTLTSGAGGAPNGGAVEAPSLMNGQNTNPLAEHYSFAQGRALFYVVQARAGKCAPPPAAQTNTAPNRS